MNRNGSNEIEKNNINQAYDPPSKSFRYQYIVQITRLYMLGESISDIALAISSLMLAPLNNLLYYIILMLPELHILQLPSELSWMLVGEITIIIFWIIYGFLKTKVRRFRPEGTLFEEVEIVSVRLSDILFYGLLDWNVTAYYASSTYSFILSFLILQIGLQPLSYPVIMLSIAILLAGIILLALALRKSKEIAIKEKIKMEKGENVHVEN